MSPIGLIENHLSSLGITTTRDSLHSGGRGNTPFQEDTHEDLHRVHYLEIPVSKGCRLWSSLMLKAQSDYCQEAGESQCHTGIPWVTHQSERGNK